MKGNHNLDGRSSCKLLDPASESLHDSRIRDEFLNVEVCVRQCVIVQKVTQEIALISVSTPSSHCFEEMLAL